MLRAALCLSTLLLLAAAAGHAGLRSSSVLQGAGEWAHRAEERLAAWRHHAFATADADAARRPLRGQRHGSGGEEAVLQVTLQLPNQQTLDIAEDATLEELMQKLLAGQVGAAYGAWLPQHSVCGVCRSIQISACTVLCMEPPLATHRCHHVI
jgi:hypothetical protein